MGRETDIEYFGEQVYEYVTTIMMHSAVRIAGRSLKVEKLHIRKYFVIVDRGRRPEMNSVTSVQGTSDRNSQIDRPHATLSIHQSDLDDHIPLITSSGGQPPSD